MQQLQRGLVKSEEQVSTVTKQLVQDEVDTTDDEDAISDQMQTEVMDPFMGVYGRISGPSSPRPAPSAGDRGNGKREREREREGKGRKGKSSTSTRPPSRYNSA
jgi:hypothetical protein